MAFQTELEGFILFGSNMSKQQILGRYRVSQWKCFEIIPAIGPLKNENRKKVRLENVVTYGL